MKAAQTRIRRSLLFVPGSRPDRFAKAQNSGADMVCIDLEDAVEVEQKQRARLDVIEFLQQLPSSNGVVDDLCEIVVRINSIQSNEGLRDLLSIIDAQVKPNAIVVAKSNCAQDIQFVANQFENCNCSVIALIETPEGLANCESIARSTDKLTAMLFGGGDFSGEIGADLSWEPMFYARGRLVAAAATARLTMIDVPYLDLENGEGLLQETLRVKAMGFTCKAAIHPSQIDTIHQAYMPTGSEIARAEKIIKAAKNSRDGVVVLDGKMVDRPIVLAAHRTLLISKATIN